MELVHAFKIPIYAPIRGIKRYLFPTYSPTHDNNSPFNFLLSFSQVAFFNLNYFYLFILAALGLRCCVRAFSSCGERGLLFVAVRRLLIVVASLVAEHRL